ncbi:MAG: hypothetical protein AUJ72_04970 [Candidatus Omnitrophica bacterium CG1_02_46_14]|nr:MAG: hypothetical protein AUJ72_04970 [Candidatus Omnitrophica bacterium CG1_02_46_14]
MIKINVKKGVVFKVIGFEFCTLARIVYRVLQKYGVTPMVTSANDGKHVPNSWHYQDLAWDWRIWGVDDPKTPIDEVKQAADEIRRAAQNADYHYDVIYGDKDHLDHIHMEYDLKKKRTV